MADRDQSQDISMDDYFTEGLAQNKAPSNPFSSGEPSKQKNHTPSGKRSVRGKRIVIILCAVLLLILILWLIIFIRKRSNDGARFAQKLSLSIGAQITSAQKNADVTLAELSGYASLNQAAALSADSNICESKKTCTIQGVRLPEWAIFCWTDGDVLSTVTYYHFKLLEKNLFGTERKAYIDPALVTAGAAVDKVEEQLDLTPYSVQYLPDHTVERVYRYCYHDGDSSDLVAYTITAHWDSNGALTSITDSRMNYMDALLFGTAQ